MDYLLILIILVITVIIGLILSRPFVNIGPNKPQEAKGADLRMTYENLLEEIKAVEKKYRIGEISKDIYQQKVKVKKQAAADVLRLIEVEQTGEGQKIQEQGGKSNDVGQMQPQDTVQNREVICPNCGSTVVSSDKFCANCGHPLDKS